LLVAGVAEVPMEVPVVVVVDYVQVLHKASALERRQQLLSAKVARVEVGLAAPQEITDQQQLFPEL
jgi:hypothetical protein